MWCQATTRFFHARQCLYDQGVETECVDVREVRLKCVSDAGEISGHRFWIDAVRHEDENERV